MHASIYRIAMATRLNRLRRGYATRGFEMPSVSRISSLLAILSMLLCVASFPVPAGGGAFCSRETGSVDLFSVTGNRATFWDNAEPPSIMFIYPKKREDLKTFQRLAVEHKRITKAVVLDNSGNPGWNITLHGVVVIGHSDQPYGPERPGVKLRCRTYRYEAHQRTPSGKPIPNLQCL